MSATNRGTKRKESDFYATPVNAIISLLENYIIADDLDIILEPSAGNGAIIDVLRAAGYENDIYAVEIRQEEKEALMRNASSVLIEDFLKIDLTFGVDVIIGNPPFSLAQEFIDKSLSLLKPGGEVDLLTSYKFS